MDVEVARNLIKKYCIGHQDFISRAEVAERYYRNKTDILFKAKKNDEEPIRNADNRITSSFYSLLVNQKASYAFSDPPIFDIGSESLNRVVADVLGDSFAKKCKDLCVNASNAGVAWVHYWVQDNEFKWAVVDSKQIIPVYNNDLEKKLFAVLRVYGEIDDETGEAFDIYEIWTDRECSIFKNKVNDTYDSLFAYNRFSIYVPNSGTNTISHTMQAVPFIPFANNNIGSSDLDNVKGQIDSYDKVYSGFINDLEDIQEVILLLTGYEGENLGEFLSNIKKYKTVKLEGDTDSKSDLRTLTIDIPVEARKELLTLARKAIFEQGQGIDPNPENFGNSSGVALKYLYSLLDLKVSLLETEFRYGFATLIRAICRFKGVSCTIINQTWTRRSVSNDVELADIAQKSVGIISQKTVLKNHPWVENLELEQKQLQDEQQEQKQEKDISFGVDENEVNADDEEE